MSLSVVIPAWCWDAETLAMAEGALVNVAATSDAERVMVYAGVEPSRKVRRLADKLVVINPPQGWAAATNIGLLYPETDYVAVGSVDIRLPAGWAETMIAAAGDDTVVSPRDYKGAVRRSWDKHERGSFWGAFFLFPRRVLEEVGYLDGYAMRRYADMDWAIRARKAGFKTARADVRAQHVAPHHTMKRHPDPHDAEVVKAFKRRHEGHERFGTWERDRASA